ncbi:cystatin-C-like [Octodon degus]|uniref:Cystatin-C-like n=1 Tax=Octodon degus TaxID=10160 RepID=A0A6P6EU87_OCTDE|nr:cystatin-C-like [Octodon degus]
MPREICWVPVVLDLAMTNKAFKFHHMTYPVFGGLEDMDSSNENVQQAVDFALREYNKDNNDLNLSHLVHVVRSCEQLVAGMNYYLDMEIGRTICPKDQPTQDDCPLSEEEPTQFCSFVVYSIPWEHYMALTDSSCHST